MNMATTMRAARIASAARFDWMEDMVRGCFGGDDFWRCSKDDSVGMIRWECFGGDSLGMFRGCCGGNGAAAMFL